MSPGFIRTLALGVITSLSASGCSDETTAPPEPQPASVTLSTDAVRFSSIGDSLLVTVTIRDANGRNLSTGASWTTENRAIATVSGTGVVKAAGNGTTILQAAAGSVSATASVVVRQEARQITLSPPTLELTWRGATSALVASATDAGGSAISAAQVVWSSSNTAVAKVESAVVTAIGNGTATITATVDAVSGTATVTVNTDLPTSEPIDPFLAAPADGYVWEIPVLVIRYLPTKDGVTLDQELTGYPRPPSHPGRAATLEEVRRRIDVFDRRVKFMLEEGSRFHGYADPSARPSLGYRIIGYFTIYEPLPVGPVAGKCDPGWCEGSAHFPDYHDILKRVNAEYWVNVRGVKEIWVWGYHWGNMVQPESNMSSPTTGDISNSFRSNDDLPVYNTTYTLYGYNFGRGHNEAVHNHGHQLEAILGHADRLQNGNSDLFWKSFVGRSESTWITGRAGWTHMPPNTTIDYDYLNPIQVSSDIEDWRPDNSGRKEAISSDRWRHLVYAWPTGNVPTIDWSEDHTQGSDQRTEAQWYIYWMQNMPGFNNTIPHRDGRMTNWWEFTSDWDGAITSGIGLSTVRNGDPISIRNDYHGGVLIDPGGGLAPGQSVTLYVLGPTVVGVYDCGEPGAAGCIMDRYTLHPGKNYRVIEHPSGPAANLTIVER